MTSLIAIGIYLAFLLGIGVASSLRFRGTSDDYFTTSHSVGSFQLLMAVFGTTMTAFALVGSTGEAYHHGIGVYGLMASWSALVHPLVFFLVGVKLWGLGRKYGYVTQIQVFRDRFESRALGYLLFPILVGLVVPYILIGILGSTSVVTSVSVGLFPEAFPATRGAIPTWLAGLVICGVVLAYVFFGGLRGAVWANVFQTLLLMVTGLVAFALIAYQLGGPAAASERVLAAHPEKLTREGFPPLHFLTYAFVPLSVGMFPHLFQLWLTARDARDFRLTVTMHPVCIMLVWLPCIFIGVWATAAIIPDGLAGAGNLVVPLKHPPNTELTAMVARLAHPAMTGLLAVGILAAGSLDSQFLCLGTMFTEDVVVYHLGEDRVSERQKVWLARGFTFFVVAATYALSLAEPRRVFTLGVWCFNGFAALFPLVVAAIYWRRATRAGAIACVAVAAVSWVALFVRADFGRHEGLIGDVMPVTFMVLASTAALVLVSLATAPPGAATLAKFFSETKEAKA